MESRPHFPPSQAKSFIPRKSHQKSRAGCAVCKQRRIKCDELKPSCSSCLRRSKECRYHPVFLYSEPERSAASTTPTSMSSIPPSDASVEQIPSHTRAGADPPSNEPVQDDCIDGQSSCAALETTLDLQLLQHFTLDVSRSLAEESKDITLWQRLVPSIAFEHAFVMHGLLALSALSYARHNLSMKTKCIARAHTHHARTLHKFIPELSNPNNANTDALYVTSVLLSFHHFAKGPRPGEYLVFGDRGQPEWLWLLGGVRTILEQRGRKPLEELDIVHAENSSFPSELLLQHVYIAALNHAEPLQQLRRLIHDSGVDFSAAVDNLEMCFTHAFADDGRQNGVRPRNHLIMAWLYLVESEFLAAAQAKQPIALIIVAYYAALLHQLNHCWLMYDWGLHLMDGVGKHLPAEYKHWLDWPAAIMNWK